MQFKTNTRGRIALAGAAAFAAYTLWLIARMFSLLAHSMTSAIRLDELTMMEELRQFHEGKYGLSYLWAPYWGHRALIPRLFMMADERLFHFSNTPLVVVNMLAQCGSAALLMWVEWRLLRDAPRSLAVLVMSVTAHLALSSLQMENFAYGMAVQYTVGLLGALASIVLMALAVREGGMSPGMALGCFACALICALSLGTGLFLCPVMLLVAFGLKARPYVLISILAIGVVFSAAYLTGYTNPGNGMGIRRALLHPVGALRIAALVLGGPVTNQKVAVGTGCGAAGMLLLLPALMRLLRRRASVEEAAMTGVCVFLLLSALGIAIARFTPEGVASRASDWILPSRYFTAPFLFWGTLFALVTGHRSLTVTAQKVIACVILGYLTLHAVPSQREVSISWLRFHRTIDVAAAGMIVGATDPQYLFNLIPDQKLLDYFRPYMLQHRLSFFADERATWPGRTLKSVFGDPVSGCRGSMDARVPAGHGMLRVIGVVEGSGLIVMTDTSGRINGLGNTIGNDFVAYQAGDGSNAYLIKPKRKACRFVP